jgi:hypothetical protein
VILLGLWLLLLQLWFFWGFLFSIWRYRPKFGMEFTGLTAVKSGNRSLWDMNMGISRDMMNEPILKLRSDEMISRYSGTHLLSVYLTAKNEIGACKPSNWELWISLGLYVDR